MTLELARRLTEMAAALVVLQGSLELLTVRGALEETFRAAFVRDEVASLAPPVRWLAASTLSPQRFLWLLGMRALLAIAWLLVAALDVDAPLVRLASPALLWTSQLAVAMRFRGTFNGGSDAMTMVVLTGATVAALPLRLGPLVGLGYVAAQAVLSYFVAGLVKLREPRWRSGEALRSFLTLRRYAVPQWITAILSRASVSRGASLVVIALECTFPLAIVWPAATLPYLAAALSFHLASTAMFGINRFVWAWAASYPAILGVTAQLHGA